LQLTVHPVSEIQLWLPVLESVNRHVTCVAMHVAS